MLSMMGCTTSFTAISGFIGLVITATGSTPVPFLILPVIKGAKIAITAVRADLPRFVKKFAMTVYLLLVLL